METILSIVTSAAGPSTEVSYILVGIAFILAAIVIGVLRLINAAFELLWPSDNRLPSSFWRKTEE